MTSETGGRSKNRAGKWSGDGNDRFGIGGSRAHSEQLQVEANVRAGEGLLMYFDRDHIGSFRQRASRKLAVSMLFSPVPLAEVL